MYIINECNICTLHIVTSIHKTECFTKKRTIVTIFTVIVIVVDVSFVQLSAYITYRVVIVKSAQYFVRVHCRLTENMKSMCNDKSIYF